MPAAAPQEFLYIYGKFGKNAKGARIALLLTVFGNVLTGGYVSLQGAGFFQEELKTNKPDEATAAALGARFLVIDEAGTSNSSGQAEDKPYVCSTVNRYCDVAGTPLVYQAKYGKQQNARVTWGMLFFGNTIPPFSGGTEAFKRRPSLMQIETRFVSEADYNPSDRTHALADGRFKNPVFLAKMAPELVHWMRRLLPALYTKRTRSQTRLAPVPRSVSELTADRLNVEGEVQSAAVFEEVVNEFRELCTELFTKPGRGKAGAVAFLPPSVGEVVHAFEAWYGHSEKARFESTMARLFAKGTYNGKWCYKTPDGKEILALKAERPARRATLGERASA